MFSSRAQQPAPQGRRGVTSVTPLPSGYQPKLSYQLGDLVFLLTRVNDEFPGNHVVRICNFEQQPQSATARPGQGSEWRMEDSDTLYRFERQIARSNIVGIRSGNAIGAPVHKKLSPSYGGTPANSQYQVGTLVYTLKEYTFKGSGREEKIPVGTKCKVIYRTSRTGLDIGYKEVQAANSIPECLYVLEALLEVYHLEYVTCSAKKEVSNFRRATPEEIAAYEAQAPPADKLIPHDGSSFARR